mmetsp:Transcript_43567/g.76293  ORF Transcript_43567/g.76293 Transcript_43567/m.76293 type:complete len:1011 (-) Transcript_43567:63-3095(-)
MAEGAPEQPAPAAEATPAAAAEPAAADSSAADVQMTEEKPAGGESAAEKPAEEGAAQGQAAEEKLAAEKAAEEKPAEEKLPAEKAAEEKPAEEKPAEEKPAEETPAEEKPPEPQPAKELEEDAPEDSRPKLKDPPTFLTSDTTINAMPSVHGHVLLALSDGGLQYLFAGARANVGVKAGRYMFEVKIVEHLSPGEAPGQRGARMPQPRQLLRVGVSTAGSTLFLGETEDSVCFDSEGNFTHNRKSVVASNKYTRDQVIGVLLNLDESSPNAHTISLFKDGERISTPHAIPDALKGKALFPAVTFRNVSVHLNFGPVSLAKMPFRCRMLQDAAENDITVLSQKEPRDGKHELIFPVFLPDQGTFDWADFFLEKHSECVELSDRKVLEWAEKSNIWRPEGYTWRNSNDKPGMGFGIPPLDDFSARRVLNTIVPAQKRSFLVMEVKANLVKEERKEALKRYSAPHFKKVALVVMGEPTKDFKERIYAILLKAKQEQSDIDFKARKVVERRNRELKKAEREKRKQMKELKKKEEAAKKAAAEQAKAAEDEQKVAEDKIEDEKPGADASDVKMAEEKVEEKFEEKAEEKAEEKEEKEEDDDDEGEDAMEVDDESPPQVTLTDEEKREWFRKLPRPDLTAETLAASFTSFSLPDKEEGFDEVRFEWQKKSTCGELLREWLLERKVTTRVDNIQPSSWFHSKVVEWSKQLDAWKQKQNEFKDPAKRKAAAEAEKKAAEENKEKENNENGKMEVEVEDEYTDDLDIFGLENVCDVGKSVPLFAYFATEDWALLSLRFELHLLAHAFRRDVNDPERVGIHRDHLAFYYSKYFGKTLNPVHFGVGNFTDVVDLIQDSVHFNPKNMVLESQISDSLDSMDIFIKLAEEARRERQRRIDSGDDSAVLKFAKPNVPPAPSAPMGAPHRSSYQPRQYRPPAQGKGGHYAVGPQQGSKPSYGYGQQQQAPRGGYAPQAPQGYRPPAGGRGYGPPQGPQGGYGMQQQGYGQKRPYYHEKASKGYGR